MIQVEHLSKKFGDLTVLEDISVQIEKGEVISIIGPSGTGKSTFLRCLNQLEKPSGGSIRIDGEDLLDKKTDVPQIRRKMNMVFQSFNLFAHLSVLGNLSIGPIKLLGTPPDKADQKSMKLLQLVGLAEKADSFPDELSGGQQQRVAIARCLAMDPKIILFDEPTSALDPTMISEVLSVIRRLAREGITLVIVTHEMDFARDVSSRVFYMDEGGIYEKGTPRQIFESPRREKTRAFIHRIRNFNYRINSPAYDLYALNAEVETFCEKQILPKETRQKIQLVIEEMLQLYLPALATTPLELTLAYSEKTANLDLIFETTGAPFDPFDKSQQPDQLGFDIVSGLCASIDSQRVEDKTRITLQLEQA